MQIGHWLNDLTVGSRFLEEIGRKNAELEEINNILTKKLV